MQNSLRLLERAFAPVGIAAVEAANRITGELVKALSTAGQTIDAFLASEAVRQAVNIANNVPGAVKFGAGIAASAVPGLNVAGAVIGASTSLPTGGPTETANAAAEAEDRRAKALKAVADAAEVAGKSQADYNAILNDAVLKSKNAADGSLNFAAALQRAGDNTAIIAPLLALQKGFSDLDKAIGEITDTDLQAFLVGQKNAANATSDFAEKQRILSDALALANDNLAEGARINTELAEARKLAEQAAAEAAKEAAQAAADAAKLLAQVAKVATDDVAHGFTEVASALSRDLDPATRVAVGQLLVLGQAQDAATLAGRRFGLSEQEIARATEGTTRQIEEQIGRLKALAEVSASAFVAGRPTQGSSNPFDQAVSQMQAGIAAAQQQYQQAQQQLAQQAADSTTQFANAVATAQKSQVAADTEFQRTYTNISLQRDVISAQTEVAIASATDKLATATRDLETKRADLLKKFQESVADAQAKFNESVASAVEKNQETIGSLTAQINDAVSASLANSRAALLAFAQTMAGVINQSVQTANSDSIALAQLQARQLAGGSTADQSALATQLTQLQAQQGFAATAAQRQIDQARQGLVDAQNASVGDVGKAQIKAQEDAKKATDELNKTVLEAAKTYQKTTDDLAKQFGEQSKALDRQASEASSSALRAIQAAENARAKQLKALEEQQRQALEKRDQAIAEAQEALRKAEADRAKRDAKLHEDQQKVEKTFLKARQDAQATVLDTLRKLPATMAEAVAQRLNLSPQTFSFGKIVAVETQADMIDAATARLRARVQSGV